MKFLGLVLLLTACTSSTQVNAPQKVAASPSGENAGSAAPAAPDSSVAKRLKDAETAGWLNGNLEAYLALFAKDAKVIAARGPQPGPYDVHFTSAAYRVLMHYQFAQPVHAAFHVETPSLELEENREELVQQTLRVTHVRKFQGLNVLERVHETFVFEQRDGQWLVTTLRYYPLSARMLGDDLYDIAKLSKLDAALNTPVSATVRDQAYALSAALRYAEAATLFRQLSAEPQASAADWVSYGYNALFAGDPVAAEQAFTQARRLDPLVQLPPPPSN